jgi:hypothetical protein
MQGESDMMMVRAELGERLEALRQFSSRSRTQDFTQAVASIRQIAAAYGLTCVVRLSDAMERAMLRPDAGGECQSALYLERLRDAIGCERSDEGASEAMIASVSVRFA